ncbi:MAG: DNA polymerase I [Clostridia bacterium]|nr:DNA polymerase I [Clostridia bacterium]
MRDKKCILIDGNSLIHRAFWALPLLTTTGGEFTNAVYGFTNMLLRIMEEEKPDYLAVAFDKGRPAFRVEAFAEYKGHRKATPDELRPQFALVKEVLAALNIPCFELEGYEADDLIGTLSAQAETEGLNTLILSGDRDNLQLVSPRVQVLLTRKGISDLDRCDEEGVEAKYGLRPEQIIDLKGLMGDSSDNIPGIPGVGEKTALKLLKEFGSVESLLANLEEVSGAKLKEKIAQNRDLALLSKKLATIVRDAPIHVEWERIKVEEPNWEQLLELYRRLEFRNLAKKVMDVLDAKRREARAATGDAKDRDAGNEQADVETRVAARDTPEAMEPETGGLAEDRPLAPTFVKVSDRKEWMEALTELKAAREVVVGFRGSRKNWQEGVLAGLVLSPKVGKAYFLDLGELSQSLSDGPGSQENSLVNIGDISLSPGGLSREMLNQELAEWWSNPEVEKICHNGKELHWLLYNEGLRLAGLAFDTMVASYLVNPARDSQSLEQVVYEHTKTVLPEGEDYLEFCRRTDMLWRLRDVLKEKIRLGEMERLFYQVELPLVTILADMEIAGVRVDGSQLEEMSQSLGEAIEELTGIIYKLCGEEFNINSTKQLAVILFEKLGLPVIKKTKTGYSTDAEVLAELAQHHEVVEKLLEYRQLVKLKSTYADGLAGLINKNTGKIHTTFNQTVTATGRLSSTEPNLQNIPIRLELGRKIRKVFVPSVPENLLLTADYSQIELRVLAHISGDENLREAFLKKQDIHTRTASEVFGVALEQVTSEMRGRAKAVNFGIVYGLSDYGLSQDIKVSRKEAKLYIDNYFDRYPGVRRYIARIIQMAKDEGYVTTLMNRRRYLPDVLSANRNVRAFGERTAMNTPIQGTAADIIKIAMVKVQRALEKAGLKTTMLLQVHDELIFEVPPEELEQVTQLVKENMEQALELSVPLVVDVKTGPNWYDVRKLAAN